MAVPSRYGSLMLSRIANPSTPYARAFSTLPALRFRATVTNYDTRQPQPPIRLNPLVGNNYVAPEPASKPAPPPPAKVESSQTNSFTPPPPPPPPSTSTTTEASKTEATNPSTSIKPDSPFPYDAADPSSDPFGALDIASIIANKANVYGQSLGIGDPLTRPKVRAKAVTGRTVFIKDRLSPSSAPTPVVAIRVLERMCREQKVKNKFHTQKFHERKGLKKKRLRSQRWRARFKTGFKAAVSKVIELKKQGW